MLRARRLARLATGELGVGRVERRDGRGIVILDTHHRARDPVDGAHRDPRAAIDHPACELEREVVARALVCEHLREWAVRDVIPCPATLGARDVERVRPRGDGDGATVIERDRQLVPEHALGALAIDAHRDPRENGPLVGDPPNVRPTLLRHPVTIADRGNQLDCHVG